IYVGMTTRYLVHLERGEHLVAVRQNMDALGAAQKFEGRPVRLAWSKEHTFVLEKGRSEEATKFGAVVAVALATGLLATACGGSNTSTGSKHRVPPTARMKPLEKVA